MENGADKKKSKIQGDLLPKNIVEEYEEILEQLDNYQGKELHDLMQRLAITAPETGNPISAPTLFNLMFETQIGPTGQFRGFLRPETAQGHFLNFKRLLEFNANSMPFASASIGKSFRNEISPRQGLLRVRYLIVVLLLGRITRILNREFTMAEIEHYVDPLNKNHPRFHEVQDVVVPLYSSKAQLSMAGVQSLSIGDAVRLGIINNQTLGYFIARIYLFLKKIGIKQEHLRFRQHMENEMAHYACDCWDAEIESSYGWIECVGCADRSAYDLTAHSKVTKESLVVRERLPEPEIKEFLTMEVNKKVFGPAFKKNAVFVQNAIENLRLSEDGWGEKKMREMQKDLEQDGKTMIVGTDGVEYTLTPDMVSIEEKKVTVHGMSLYESEESRKNAHSLNLHS